MRKYLEFTILLLLFVVLPYSYNPFIVGRLPIFLLSLLYLMLTLRHGQGRSSIALAFIIILMNPILPFNYSEFGLSIVYLFTLITYTLTYMTYPKYSAKNNYFNKLRLKLQDWIKFLEAKVKDYESS